MRALLRFFIILLVCLPIIYVGYFATVSLTGDISATSFFFNPSSHRNTTITASSDTPLDIAADGPFCLFRDENKVDVICSTPDPRPGSPNAAKLTTTLKTGKWSVFTTNKGIDMYLESDLPLVYNRHNVGAAIVIDVLLLLMISSFIILFTVGGTDERDN